MSDLNEIECGQLCQTTIESLYEATGGLRNFPGLLKKIIKNKAWERRVSKGKVFELASLRELITAKPLKGWGEDPKKVEAVIKDDPEVLAMFRDAMLGEHGGDKKSEERINGNNVTNDKRVTGNSRAYSIDRVKREAPQFLAAVMAKKMTPNAALVKAGIRENRQVYIPREPAKAVSKIIEQFGKPFIVAMMKCVNAQETRQ